MLEGVLFFLAYAIAALGCAMAAVAVARIGSLRRPDRTASIAALTITAIWCGASAALGSSYPAVQGIGIIRNLLWIFVLYRLFAIDRRNAGLLSVRTVVTVLAFVELLQAPLLLLRFDDVFGGSATHTVAILRVLLSLGTLVLLHDLVAKTNSAHRGVIAWSAGGLVLWWGFALNYHLARWLTSDTHAVLEGLRPLVALSLALMVAIGFARSASTATTALRLRPSREFTLQCIVLMAFGAFVVVLVFASRQFLAMPGDVSRVVQVAFLLAAAALAILWLPSQAWRRKVRVLVLKHLFRHRYDYRSEWIRFTETIGRERDSGQGLKQRAIQSLADIADSPGGLLFTPDADGVLRLESEWNWPDADIPTPAAPLALVRILEQTRFILEFDEVRHGISHGGEAEHVPQWLVEDVRAWAGIPLVLRNRLVGLVVLARPAQNRGLDWEDYDLLGIAGCQVASYLAEQAGQEALEEVGRFDEFNRRIAFVMHDVKNLSSQMGLLVRNAERHADNPEFRKDMLTTLRNSTDKLDALIARLGRYGARTASASERIDLAKLTRRIAQRLRAQHTIQLSDNGPCPVMGDLETLEQAVAHLAQNAIDASASGTPVRIETRNDGLRCSVSIADSGEGMSAQFIRNDLFRPFVSTKSGGFGIGAHEAQAAIRGMGGRLDVESREGVGTRFTMDFPIADLETLMNDADRLHESAA